MFTIDPDYSPEEQEYLEALNEGLRKTSEIFLGIKKPEHLKDFYVYAVNFEFDEDGNVTDINADHFHKSLMNLGKRMYEHAKTHNEECDDE